MIKIKFSEENFIILREKNRKIKEINLGEFLNSKISYYKNKFKDQIDEFIKNLKKQKKNRILELDKNFDFSILNNFYEKNIWKNPEIIELLKCLALEDIIKQKKILKIDIKAKDEKIYFFLRNSFSKKKKITTNFLNNNLEISEGIRNFFTILRTSYGFLKTTIFEIILKKNRLKFRRKNVLFITYSTIFNFKNKIEDFYWEKLNLKDYPNSTKLIINSDDYSNKKKIDIINNSKKMKKNFEFLESYQNIKVLFKTFKIWLNLIFIFSKFTSNSKYNPFFKKYLMSSITGYSSLKNINLIYLLDYFFNKNNYKKVNYLFENLTWEKALIKILKNRSEILAYQHTSVRDWDFRYDPSYYDISTFGQYFPNKIYANSLYSKNKLQKNFKQTKIFKSKNSRYSEKNLLSKKKKLFKNRLLVIGDIDMDETNDMINIILNNVNDKFRVDLKLHPSNQNIKIQNKNLSLIYENLNKVIHKYKYILCSNSTTSIYEVLLRKKIPFVYQNKNNLNLCPVKKMKNINYISTKSNVKNMIFENYNNKFDFKKFKKFYV